MVILHHHEQSVKKIKPDLSKRKKLERPTLSCLMLKMFPEVIPVYKSAFLVTNLGDRL